MKTSKVLINVLIVLLVLVALWLGYVWLTSDREEGALPTVSVSSPDSGVTPEEQSEFLRLFNRLGTINFDESSTQFLNDPVFTTELRDYTTTLTEGPRGRQNPFAPFGSGDASPTTPVPAVSEDVDEGAFFLEDIE